MTGRTSSIKDHSPNCIAFRAGIGMLEAKFMMLNVPELGETRLLNASARCSDQRPNYTTSTSRIDEIGPASRFPHRPHPDPTAGEREKESLEGIGTSNGKGAGVEERGPSRRYLHPNSRLKPLTFSKLDLVLCPQTFSQGTPSRSPSALE
jgi:hypothetical protein